MKTLILTGGFGMGHICAAQAIKEKILIDEPNSEVDIIDAIDYIFPELSKGIYNSFDFMVSKCSSIYNFFNRITARRASVPLKKSVVNKIDKLLKDKNVDMIISTFPACSQYISTYKKMKNNNTPLLTYITDINVNEEWISEKTDMYFVGSEETKQSLISKGVNYEKIIVSGIPVKKDFIDEISIEKKSNKKNILIMGGGLGLIQIDDKLLSNLESMEDIEVIFIAGKNEKLFKIVKEKYPNIETLGYCNNVYDYMKKADLVITKSGGITLFEAINCNTPLYVIRPFLCQEIGNARFIQKYQIGKVIWSEGTDICEDLISLVKNEILLSSMKNNIKMLRSTLDNPSPFVYYDKGVESCY